MLTALHTRLSGTARTEPGHGCRRGGKGAGFMAFPLQLETKADSCVQFQQSGPTHPSGWSRRKSRWPVASPSRSDPLSNNLSPLGPLPALKSWGAAPCPNTKPSPLGIVPLTPQTLSLGSNGPLGTTQEPTRPLPPCWATLPTLTPQIWDLLFRVGQSLDGTLVSS